MKKKNNLGQFYTTNSKYIIGNLLKYLPDTSPFIDPFAGNWDLLNILSSEYKKSGYDIDPKNDQTIELDTLSNPPKYNDCWIITNPPYLAKNKNNLKSNKSKFKKNNSELFEKYQTNDLYKVALKTIMNCEGGILIIPLNFFCEENSKIREEFLSQFEIKHLNIFEEQVFDDTTYTVCSFAFEKSATELLNQKLDITIFPSKEKLEFIIEKKSNFRLANEFYDLLKVESDIKISRLIKGDKSNSNLKLRALDTGSMDGRISLSIDEPYFDETPNQTERAFATLKFNHKFTKNEQEFIAEKFNSILEKNRKKYHSLFLTNFRNSTSSYARKRISFDVAYKLVIYIIETYKDQFTSL